jgi:hypothetical protein
MATGVITAPDIEPAQEAPDGPLVLRVTVTPEHIRDGVRECVSRCPLVLAIRARGFDCAAVARGLSYWSRCGNATVFARPLPETAEFIRRFDAGLPVEPGEYGFEVLP